MKSKQGYIPALRFHALTPLYDWVLRWVMREKHFKKVLVQIVNLQAGQKVLDLGCGTATLTIMLKKAYPASTIIGLDGDPSVLAKGQWKAEKAGVDISLEQGMAYDLPYPAASFHVVLSSLMFHHLKTQDKQSTLKEIYRVLCPSGWLFLLDFGPPVGIWSSLISPIMARLEEVGDHQKGLIPTMMRLAGFQDVAVLRRFETLFGTLYLLVGNKRL